MANWFLIKLQGLSIGNPALRVVPGLPGFLTGIYKEPFYCPDTFYKQTTPQRIVSLKEKEWGQCFVKAESQTQRDFCMGPQEDLAISFEVCYRRLSSQEMSWSQSFQRLIFTVGLRKKWIKGGGFEGQIPGSCRDNQSDRYWWLRPKWR